MPFCYNRFGDYMKKRNTIVLFIIIVILTVAAWYILYRFNYLPHKKYTDKDFGIVTYKSSVDRDGDGIDDQTDILNNVKSYLKTNPKYKSKYYNGGYPDDEYGVCTDVVARGLKGAGYDLMELVDADKKNNPANYNNEKPDKNIDFRRVRNLKIYFDGNAISLTTDIGKISEWQGGDIVVFNGHIGVVSEHRNTNGVPFVYHHANPLQRFYEEDILEVRDDIIGHYRIS